MNSFSLGSRFGTAAPLTRRQPREESRSKDRTLCSSFGFWMVLEDLLLAESSEVDMMIGLDGNTQCGFKNLKGK